MDFLTLSRVKDAVKELGIDDIPSASSEDAIERIADIFVLAYDKNKNAICQLIREINGTPNDEIQFLDIIVMREKMINFFENSPQNLISMIETYVAELNMQREAVISSRVEMMKAISNQIKNQIQGSETLIDKFLPDLNNQESEQTS